MSNKSLNNAIKNKNDEFYTPIDCIEKEMVKYDPKTFNDKTVLCNCNDGYSSNFFCYFRSKFQYFKLKKLIGIKFTGGGTGYVIEYDGEDISYKDLIGNGSFESEESIEYLKQSDIVVTNPPFSLFRKYVSILIEYGKKFIILGNKNQISTKETFMLIIDHKMWISRNSLNLNIYFKVPEYYFKVPEYYKIKNKKDLNYSIKHDGTYISRPTCWYTNIEQSNHNEILTLTQKYSNDKYPKYDTYNAINVNKVSDIPYDYDGIMGVPITIMNKYNPNQFEIVGEFNHGQDSIYDLAKPVINGKLIYKRIAIKNIKGETNND